jgi:hypothetical protein
MRHSRRKRKCQHCNVFFLPDYRNVRHQRYCARPECRKASKINSQRRWLHKPENRDHFRGPDHVQRVQQWRQDHPGYWRCKTSETSEAQPALQDHCTPQSSQKQSLESDFAASALQDICSVQLDVFIGLIAHLTGLALQEDIAIATRRLQQLGRDILAGSTPKQGDLHDPQTTPVFS